MQGYESERDLQAQIAANIQNLQQFYGLNSVDSLKQLVDIILDPKKSDMLFKQRNVTVSSIFQQKKDPGQINQEHARLFAEKYSYQKLVQKFPKPKGETNRMLISILQKKLSVQTIGSHQTRKNVWMLVSGARFNMNHHKGLYQHLLHYDEYPDYFMRAIKQDINRTVAKSQTSEEELKSLSNVLIAFSRRNPFVGYCQGLNFVAYFLLTMQFTEEETFWLFSSIIETVIPMDYYTNMIGVVCDQQVFLAVLGRLYPQITQKFDEVGLDPSVLSIQWFVCLFTSSLPFYLVKVVWDRLLVQGPRAFLKTGLIILAYFQQQILQVTEFHEIIMLLQKGTKQLNLPESQFNARFEDVFISRQGLILARTLYRQYHLKQKLSQKMTGKKRSTEPLVCNPAWPICVVGLEKNRQTREETEIWIFREGRAPIIDPQYLINSNSKQSHQKGNRNSINMQRNFKKIPGIAANLQDFIKLQSIREEGQSIYQENSQYQKHAISHNPNPSLQQNSFIIGRMQHICGVGYKDNCVPEQKKSKMRRSLIVLEKKQNRDLKNENLRKLMDMNNDQGQEMGESEQLICRRSQTVKFFSQFLNDNTQLSNIIIPSSKVN